MSINNQTNAKRIKFVELAERRTQKILDGVELLGNLHNTSNYEYTETDYRKIFRVIRAAVNEAQGKFEGKQPTKRNFKL